jgi:hypothetical protein
MEEGIFPRPAVAGELGKLIEARLHYDGARKQEVKALQRDLAKTYAAPVYLILDPKTRAILRRLDGVTSEEKFLEFLRGTY